MKQLSKGNGMQTRFELSAEPGSQVFVAGSFNNWNPTANPLKDNPDSGHYKAALRIPPGNHEYKFIVNGVWMPDPNCSNWSADPYGGFNSVVHV